ncbi:MAG: Ig-like domain-containing protein [Deltaproteobacteria bacterium]|nr:Ig-like domain-containing protein [Deltaproteobacteria bacterium]
MFRSLRPAQSARLALLALTLACQPEPVRIVVKLPKDMPESTQLVPFVPTFTEKNMSLRLRASAFDKLERYMGPAKVKWTSSDPSVAVVAQDGLVTILSSGKAKITAETTETQTPLVASIEIPAAIPAKVKIDPPEGDKNPAEIHLGEIKQFKAVVLNDRDEPIPDAKILWRSTTYAVTVTPTGEVEGAAMGETQLVAEHKSYSAKHALNVLDWKK